MSDWKPYAVRLADQLHASGDLQTPAWHAAIANTRLNTADHLELVYSTSTAVKLTAADGSRCEVELTPSRNGTRTVREGGPTPLWTEIERAYQQWYDCGEPGWDRVGITITPQAWTVWLDEPHNIISRMSPPD